MRGNLSVRVDDGVASRLVTQYVRGLRFRKTAPGGHHSASMTLVLPRSTFSDLGPADKIYVYDSRSARTIWEGYAENTGTTDGPQGQSFELSAMGGMVLASDRAERLIYLDTALDMWRRDDYGDMAPSAATNVGALPDTGTPGLMLQFPPGQPIATASTARMVYDAFLGSVHQLGGFAMVNRCGITDANYESKWFGQTTQLTTRSFSTGGLTVSVLGGAAMGMTRLSVLIQRVAGGATNVATDTVWGGFATIRVRGRLADKYGVNLSPSQADYVLASDVVTDMLARLLGGCDPAASTVAATTAQIDQLAYHDATTAARVFDDLSLHEPDFLWEILHSTSAGHVFNFRAWPTTPRYEISVKDGYQAPGGEADLCNRIAVTWTDTKGQKRAEIVTATVAALGSRTKDAEPITLPDGLGSAANAQRIGAQVLASKNTPPKAATVRVRRPLLDKLTGSTVMPWEIEPGYLVRVRETGDDLRLTEMEYEDTDCTATLTLGTPQRSQEQLLAALARRSA